MKDVDYLVMKEIAKILIRKGVITSDEVQVAVENLRRVSASAANNFSMLALEASTMSPSEFEADFRRRQMRERTAFIERQGKGDGGNSGD
ncbi:hypothetical protein [Novosphingobium sp. ZW T3_23]|uniref:hypothetical protein n=1 Tax=Novosphingobium sp. ZW T3_23 TaxID=3378084 RepID=UPI00385388F3